MVQHLINFDTEKPDDAVKCSPNSRPDLPEPDRPDTVSVVPEQTTEVILEIPEPPMVICEPEKLEVPEETIESQVCNEISSPDNVPDNERDPSIPDHDALLRAV